MNENLKNIAIQSLVWTVAFISWTMLRQFGQELVEEPIEKSLLEHLLFYLSIGFISGLTFVFTGVFLRKRLRKIKTFGVSILINTLFYLLTFIVLVSIGIFLFMLPSKEAMNSSLILNYLFSEEGLLLLFYFFFILILVEFVKQVDKKFGPGNLVRMIKGEFYQPKEVERIVMFLDLKSSTTIAEKIGHIKFSRLLQDCFQELNIVKLYGAEIYQYVGDEVVLTWEKSKGLKNLNCLEFYFAYRNELKAKSDYYQQEYGLVPEFKCGCHIGEVVMTEIGQIKREIAYHGDVMNTASRIQNECTKRQKDFLISKALHNVISPDTTFTIQVLDTIKLRGKLNEVEIYSVNKK